MHGIDGAPECSDLSFGGDEESAELAALERNMADHLAFLPAALPGGLVDDTNGVVLVDSGVPCDTFNAVCRARLTPRNAGEVIDSVIAHFRSRNFPFTWWVGPTSTPRELGTLLSVRGLRFAELELGMRGDLSEPFRGSPLPVDLEVRAVRTTSDLHDYASVLAANWAPPDTWVLDVHSRAAHAVLQPDAPSRCFVGYLDGTPVATSECFLSRGIAGIFNVVTLPRARRRGIGTALTDAALDAGRSAGYLVAGLQASQLGKRVYERLGFRACCEFQEFQ